MTALKTRRPTGKPSWPIILIAGVEKSGKSYAAAALSASDLVDRTLWIEVGEGSADLYGALPGARYEIVEHDGSYAALANAAEAATQQATDAKPHAIVVDSMTEIWDLLSDEQQVVANRRRGGKAGAEAPITMDQWNTAKKRWRKLLDTLRGHNGPVILTARLERVAVVGTDGKPTAEKEWKIRAEKNLPFEVDAIVEIPEPRKYYLNGVRSLALQVPPGGHMPYPDFTLERLLTDLGLADGTTPRQYTAPKPEAFADVTAGADHEELRQDVNQGSKPVTRAKWRAPEDDEWSTPPVVEVPMNATQKGRMFALFSEHGIKDRDARLRFCSVATGRDVQSTSTLTEAEAETVISHLKRGPKSQQEPA